MGNKHASQSRGGRGLDLGKQKHWIVVCSVCSSLELEPVTKAGRAQRSVRQPGAVGAASKDSSVG